MTEITKVILLINLIILQLVWKFTTSYTLKEYLRNFFTLRAFLIMTIALILIMQLLGFDLPIPNLSNNHLISAIGLIINSAGLAVAVWAKLTMKANWGPPAQHNIEKQQHLVISGPYRFSRNPIYLGMLLILTGFEIALKSSLVIIVLPVFLIIDMVIKKEEKLVEKHFGRQYLVYKRQVPRYLKLNFS